MDAQSSSQTEIQDLLWLLDAPLFIDEHQVKSFYDAVVRPDILENPADDKASIRYIPKTLTIEVSDEENKKFSGTVGGEAKGTLGVLASLFPTAEATLKAEVGGESGTSKTKGRTIELAPVETPQRQLVHLAAYYFINVSNRLFLVNDPSTVEWRSSDSILKSPRALAFLDLPKTTIIPTAAEFENNKIELLYTKLVAKSGERPPEYPELPKVSEVELPNERRKYWNWFRDHISASKAMQVVEEAASTNGKIRWIDYRMPINIEGDTLHLHLCPNGKYDSGVLAYNFIKRGQKHGLRLVGTLKSEPDMNVLAVYER